MTAAHVRSLRLRYWALLTLRFLPTGMFVTVFVLLMQERGLSLADIGVATAAQGVVMLVLELPSGGLADALGRKPVLLLAGVFSIAAGCILLVAGSVAVLAAVSALNGVYRALDSGPLQAWFIDGILAAEPDAEIERDLARADVVICASIGAGALLASVITRTDGIAGLSPLVAPLVMSVGLQVISLVAVATLMHEHRPGAGWAAARQSIGDVPAVVRDAVGIIRADRLLIALVTGELLWGFGMVTFEILFPPRLAEVHGGVESAAGLVGPAITAAWILSALGAVIAPALVRRFGAGWTGCGLRLLHGAAVVAMALAAGPVGVIVAYLANYWAHGATAPVHYGMVHRAVDSAHRATVVSANSLTSQVGGAVGGIALGALADATSISTAMITGAVVLAAAGPLYLVRRSPSATVAYDEPAPLNV